MRLPAVGMPLMVAAALAAVVSGCGAGPAADGGAGAASGSSTVAPVSSAAAVDRREVEVYAAVLRHHLSGRTNGGPVYLVDRAVPDAADPMRGIATGVGTPIPPEVRDQLARELADLGPISFVPDANVVIGLRDGCPTVTGGGVVLTLAPVPADGDRLEIGVGDFRACLDGRWQTYVVVHDDTGWTVQGTTGPVSIS